MLIPTALAMAAAVQWVTSPGGSVAVSATTRATSERPRDRMRDGRSCPAAGYSPLPAWITPASRQTTDLLLRVRRMISAMPRPSNISSTLLVRHRCFCKLYRLATTASRGARSSDLTFTTISLHILQVRTIANPRESSKGLSRQINTTRNYVPLPLGRGGGGLTFGCIL